MILLKELISGLNYHTLRGTEEVSIKGIAYDSRQVESGYVFIAIEGFKTDGHNYINSALDKGAVAVVVQKDLYLAENITVIKVDDSRKALALMSAAFYHFPSDKLAMIGVTGTNGKTTTTHLIEAILEENGEKVGLIGTINNKIGATIIPSSNTTPESLDLQRILREMISFGVTSGVMEVSSHALELQRVAGCEFDIAVFTNITQDHLDFHENMDSYLEAKKKLFTNLQENIRKNNVKYGIINIDDPKGQEVVQATKGQVITYGVDGEANIKAEHIQITPAGVSFKVVGDFESIDLNLKITGKFNVYNALAAFAVGVAKGIPMAKIKKALENVSGVAGRFELVYAGQPFTVVVDYAHTPDGLENILKTAQEFVSGRIITVFGCGGDRDRTKRPIMGEISAQYSDYSVITSDNPRSEEPEAIISEIEAGVKNIATNDQYSMITDRKEGIRVALTMAQQGDVVLIAGKGHENYQILKAETIHFDDREIALEILQELGFSKS